MTLGPRLDIGGYGPHLVISGSPVSGKSIIAKRIAERLGLVYISSGNIVREIAEQWPELQDALKAGGTIDSPRIDNAIMKHVIEFGERGWILDGFPRFVSQWQKIFLAEQMGRVDAMCWVESLHENAIVHAKKRGRSDDTQELVSKRWAWFESRTRQVFVYASLCRVAPVINYFNLHATEELSMEDVDQYITAIRAGLPSRIHRPGGNDIPPFTGRKG